MKSKDRGCNNPNCENYKKVLARPIEECKMVLNNGEFGFDVIIAVGEMYLDEHKSEPEIHRVLREKYIVDICERTVGYLLESYLALCSCVDGNNDNLQRRLKEQGGIVLSVDGVQFDSCSPVLYVIRDAISGEILFSQRSILRGEEDLARLLEKVKNMNIPIIAIISDKETGLLPAIKKVFPNVPHQLCQYHFLNNLSNVLEDALKELGKKIKDGIKSLKLLRKRLLEMLRSTSQIQGKGSFSKEEIELALNMCEMAFAASKRIGQGPMNPSALRGYHDLLKIQDTVAEACKKGNRAWPVLEKLKKALSFLDTAESLASKLDSCVEIIRKIAHILKMENDAKQIKQEFQTYLDKLKGKQTEKEKEDACLKNLFLDHVVALSTRYWPGLFFCYDDERIPSTNNSLESEFGSVKRAQRKITGKKSTSGGIIESAGELYIKARSLIKNVSNLADELRKTTYERFSLAMAQLREIKEPARQRRSFLRNPESFLRASLEGWNAGTL